jgi:hypothetical protein
MFNKIMILVGAIVLMLNVVGQSTMFFPEDGTPVKNFKKSLPQGYDDPKVVHGQAEKQQKVVITHMPPLEAKKNTEINLAAGIVNLPQGAIVLIHYRMDPLNQYRDIAMNRMAPGRYSITIPGQLLDSDQLQYYIEATFAGNLLAKSGGYANPHRVVLVGSNGIPTFALVVVFAVAGLWLFSKISIKRGVKGKIVAVAK